MLGFQTDAFNILISITYVDLGMTWFGSALHCSRRMVGLGLPAKGRALQVRDQVL